MKNFDALTPPPFKDDVTESLFAAQSGLNKGDSFVSLVRYYYMIWLCVPLVSVTLELIANWLVSRAMERLFDSLVLVGGLAAGLVLGAYVLMRPIRHYLLTQEGRATAEKRTQHIAEYGAIWTFLCTMAFCILVENTGHTVAEREYLQDPAWQIVPHSLMALYFAFLVLVLLADFRGRLRFAFIRNYHLSNHSVRHRFKARFVLTLLVSGLVPLLLIAFYTATVDIFDLRRVIVSLSVISILSALLVYVSYVRAVNRPLYNLLNAFTAVRQGQYNVRVPITSFDEIGVATDAFNTMMDSLEERRKLNEAYGGCLSSDQVDSLLATQGKTEETAGEATILVVSLSAVMRDQSIATRECRESFVDIHAAIISTIHANGGVVLSMTGNNIIASFNMPLPESTHARHGVKAALDTLLAVHRPLGVGVATGPVVGGLVGKEAEQTYGLMGPPVNMAEVLARRSTEVGYGVLVDPKTHESVRDFYEIHPLPGSSDAHDVYQVILEEQAAQ